MTFLTLFLDDKDDLLECKLNTTDSYMSDEVVLSEDIDPDFSVESLVYCPVCGLCVCGLHLVIVHPWTTNLILWGTERDKIWIE